MGKIKIGDRVVATKTFADITAGNGYAVVEVDNDDEGMPVRVIDDEGDRYWLYSNQFRLLSPAFTLETGTFYRTRSGKPTGRMGQGDTGFEAIVDGLVRIYDAAGGHVHGSAELDIVEVWTPKIGERVRVADNTIFRSGTPIGCEGLVKNTTNLLSLLVSIIHPSDGLIDQYCSAADLEPLTVATPQPALAITAGKFYRTRDGRRVGPMVNEGWSDNEPWTAPGYGYCGDSGKWNTMSATPDSDDLIAEWQETTNVGAQVDTLAEEYGPFVLRNVKLHVNDNAAKPKFKVGDRISGYAPAWGDKTGVITKVDETDRNQFYRIRDEDSGFGMWLENYSVKPAPSTTQPTAIVALIEDGKPKPADIPHVHANQAAAEREAKRLSGVHKGKQFGVYVLATTAEEPAPVYAHEWQRYVAERSYRYAATHLMRLTGLTRPAADAAVEAYAKQAA